MGTLFRPKGVCAWGLGRRAGRLRICGSGRFLGSLSDSVSILKTSGRWADEVMIYGSAFLRPVQRLHVRGHARPRGVAVRAASCCSAPAHQMRSRIEPAFYGPRRADESSTCSRHRQASRRRTHGSRRRQGSFAQQRQGNQDAWNPAWLRQLDPSDLEQDSYDWVDVSPPLPRVMAENGPWSNREGWKIRVCSHIPVTPQTIRRPGYWPFADLFCIRPADHPSWLERQLPPQPVSHLPVRGYCSHTCDRYSANTHGFRCVGLCLRPVMYGERAPHDQHTCINCLKGH